MKIPMKTKTFLTTAAVAVLIGTSAFAQSPATSSTMTPSATANSPTGSTTVLQQIPSNATTVTNFYKQNVYDPSDTKVGEISDVLLDRDGKVTAMIVSVGGFLGVGQKDVAVPFDAVHATKKNNSWYLVMNASKDSLKNAPGYKYDKSTTSWVPASS
jgi:sporulation protein YlmC with PRC-barrel domain